MGESHYSSDTLKQMTGKVSEKQTKFTSIIIFFKSLHCEFFSLFLKYKYKIEAVKKKKKTLVFKWTDRTVCSVARRIIIKFA